MSLKSKDGFLKERLKMTDNSLLIGYTISGVELNDNVININKL